MPDNNQRLVSRAAIYILLGLVVLGFIVYGLRGILAPVLFAFLLAYAFNPLVEFLARHRVSRTLASVICLALLIFLCAGIVAMLVPTIQYEIHLLTSQMPTYLRNLQEGVLPWIEETFGVGLPATFDAALESARKELPQVAEQWVDPLGSVLTEVLSSILALVASLVYLIIIPLFTYYFLHDYRKITAWFTELIPPRHRERVLAILGEMDVVLAGFLRGQLTICSILALGYAILLAIIGVPAAVTIGIVAGLFNMVPYLGTATGILLSSLFLLLEGASWPSFVGVLAVFAGLSVLDGLVLTPRILGKRLGLAPVAVILAVMAFGEVFGFLGVLMAVPVTAIGKVLARHGLQAYRRSRTYQAGDP